MVPSEGFVELVERINEIEENFVETEEKEGIEGSTRRNDHLRAYRILVHAEIEYFIEEQAKELVKSCLRNWKENQYLNKVLISIVGFVETDFGTMPKAISDDNQRGKLLTIDSRIEKAVTNYFHLLKRNHGVKEKNLVQILLPIGIDLSELDNVWVSTMNSFGEERGDVAHKAAKMQESINAADELKKTKDILRGLREVDKKLQASLIQK